MEAEGETECFLKHHPPTKVGQDSAGVRAGMEEESAHRGRWEPRASGPVASLGSRKGHPWNIRERGMWAGGMIEYVPTRGSVSSPTERGSIHRMS